MILYRKVLARPHMSDDVHESDFVGLEHIY